MIPFPSPAQTYRAAVKTLQPSVAEMARRMAPAHALTRQARDIVDSMGLTLEGAQAAYMARSAVRHDDESGLDKAIRVELLGRIRRGK